uniref:hypothetical protein n=1 Tax=Chitinimonas sp. TaxID=1934313 RepID=UPI0035B082AD
LLLGLLVPLTLRLRRLYVRLVTVISFLALSGVVRQLWCAACGDAGAAFDHFVTDLLLWAELAWLACLGWEWLRARQGSGGNRSHAPLASRWRPAWLRQQAAASRR